MAMLVKTSRSGGVTSRNSPFIGYSLPSGALIEMRRLPPARTSLLLQSFVTRVAALDCVFKHYALTIVLKPPKIMRLPSNGAFLDFIIALMRLSFMTFAMT